MTFKRVYVVDRNPSLSHGEFAPRWKQHAELSMQFPELPAQHSRLAYCCTLEQESGIPGASRQRDGVGMLWVRSPEMLKVQPRDPRMRPTMRADELLVFTGNILESLVTVKEELKKDGRGARFCLISFLQRQPELSVEAFREAWQRQANAFLESAGASPQLHRYVLGSALGKPTFPCDGISEMWFHTAADAVAFCGTPQYLEQVINAQDRFALAQPLTLLMEVGHAWSAPDDPYPQPHP